MTTTTNVREVLGRSAITLLVAALIIAGALAFNSPSEATVDFELVCRSFEVPGQLPINLNRGPTQIASAELYGYEGDVGRISTVDGTVAPAADVRLVAAASGPPPYLDAIITPPLNSATVHLAAGVAITGLPGGVLRLESTEARSVTLAVKGEAFDVQGTRYRVPRGSTSLEKRVRLNSRSPADPVTLVARSMASPGALARADISFRPVSGPIDLVLPTAPLGLQRASLQFQGALAPTLIAGNRSLPGVQDDRMMNLDFDVEEGQITQISLIMTKDGTVTPLLRVAGSVRATSVRQGRAERLPTWLEETLETSNVQRSAWLTALGVSAFILFKAVDAALSAVLKLWIKE